MGRSRVTPKRLCDTVVESNPLPTMTVLAINSFDIVSEPAGNYAVISADVETLVHTYYDEPIFVPTSCEAKVLLSDDQDLDALQQAAEPWELVEDISVWYLVDDY